MASIQYHADLMHDIVVSLLTNDEDCYSELNQLPSEVLLLLCWLLLLLSALGTPVLHTFGKGTFFLYGFEDVWGGEDILGDSWVGREAVALSGSRVHLQPCPVPKEDPRHPGGPLHLEPVHQTGLSFLRWDRWFAKYQPKEHWWGEMSCGCSEADEEPRCASARSPWADLREVPCKRARKGITCGLLTSPGGSPHLLWGSFAVREGWKCLRLNCPEDWEAVHCTAMVKLAGTILFGRRSVQDC